MEANKTPKWQEEIEEILRKQFPMPELLVQLRTARELVNLSQEVEIPTGDRGQVVAQMLKLASEQLLPLASIYAGFQLGVAWEKYQNANRA